MEKQQTAVQWLVNEILMPEYGHLPKWVIDKVNEANQMFEEQIVKSFDVGYENGACVNEGKAIYHGSNYYNETFKTE